MDNTLFALNDYATASDESPDLSADQAIADEVLTERRRQDSLWGEQALDAHRLYGILAEEFGEVGRAINEATFAGADWSQYRKELIHTAAVAHKMIKLFDKYGPLPDNGRALSQARQWAALWKRAARCYREAALKGLRAALERFP